MTQRFFWGTKNRWTYCWSFWKSLKGVQGLKSNPRRRKREWGTEHDWFSWMNKALKCIWIKRFRLNENSAWTVIPNKATLYLGGFSFLSNCYCSSKDISIKKLPLFYIRTLQYWFEFKDMQEPGIKNTIIWNDKDIKIDNNTIFFRTWFSRGVSTVENLLDHNLDFITYEQFKPRYQIKTNFLTYYGAINAIPNEYKKSIKQTNAQKGQPTQSELESKNNQGYTWEFC